MTIPKKDLMIIKQLYALNHLEHEEIREGWRIVEFLSRELEQRDY
jgi:hypothetical protein